VNLKNAARCNNKDTCRSVCSEYSALYISSEPNSTRSVPERDIVYMPNVISLEAGAAIRRGVVRKLENWPWMVTNAS
jgi:hypothetical protein